MNDEAEIPEGSRWVEVPGGPPAAGSMRGLEIGGLRVVVCQVGSGLHALVDRCPHGLVRLSHGTLRGHVIECPLHGGKLDVRDGEPVALPIGKPAGVLPVECRDGALRLALPEGVARAAAEEDSCTT